MATSFLAREARQSQATNNGAGWGYQQWDCRTVELLSDEITCAGDWAVASARGSAVPYGRD
jgi:hypothetical protein